MTEALFKIEGASFLPTSLAGSPWHPDVLHGGAPAGLLAFCLEREVEGSGLQPAKLSIDLLRPVPKASLSVKVRTLRKGKRILLLAATLQAGDSVVAEATCLFIKPQMITLPEFAYRETPSIEPPHGVQEVSFRDILFGSSGDLPPGLHTTIQLRPVTTLNERGRGIAWVALPVSIVSGHSNTPFMLAALAADFGNGVGQLRLGENMGTINVDIILQLSRLPDGDWIGIDSVALMDEMGIGQVTTTLHDIHGRIGQVSQTIMPMGEYGG